MGSKKVNVTKLSAPDTSYRQGTIESNAALPEDEFVNLYVGASGDADIIQPPYNKHRLIQLVMENNALSQCISAMEVNIDGTGHVIEPKDPKKATIEDDPEITAVNEFFAEVYPGVSMLSLRRKVRFDIEATGEAYIEVIRNVAGDIVFLRHIESAMMRIKRLGNAVTVRKTVTRRGKTMEVSVSVRERVFAQKIGTRLVYFKEYGASRDLDKTTGVWAEKVVANKKATEVIHLRCFDDAATPYGVPRWIPQSPSVVGSRKAETYNLDFFDAGGIPPIIVFLTSGVLDPEVRLRLEQVFNSTAKAKARGAVVEVQPIAGGLDSTAKGGVQVERFGAERQQDAMFEKYDDKCEQRIRSAFRLPPMFVGKASDYSFATAYASYMVAEAQVFAPERVEFDEVMNVTLMKELSPEYLFRSLATVVKDVEHQLKGIEIIKDSIPASEVVKAINEVVGVGVAVPEDEEPAEPAEPVVPAQGYADGQPGGEGGDGVEGDAAYAQLKAAKMDVFAMEDIVTDFMGCIGLGPKVSEELYAVTRDLVTKFDESDRLLFNKLVAARLTDHDDKGTAEVCGCIVELM